MARCLGEATGFRSLRGITSPQDRTASRADLSMGRDNRANARKSPKSVPNSIKS
jgi:hypothetical protein